MYRNLLISLVSLLFSYVSAELFVHYYINSREVLPLVKYETELKNVELWAYDKHFRGRADFDLRRDIPYDKVKYCCNEDRRKDLHNLDPAKVPHAIEVVFGPQAFRERNLANLTQEPKVHFVVGDSFCFGQGVREVDRFTNLIEAELEQRAGKGGDEKEFVVSGCYCGQGARGMVERVEEFAPKHWVKRVLYAYVLNDPVGYDSGQVRETFLNNFTHRRIEMKSSALDPKAELGWRTPLMVWRAERQLLREQSEATIELYRSLHKGAGWQETKRLILKARDITIAQKKPFVLLVFPLFYQFEDYPFRGIHQKLVSFANESGIPVLDLFLAFEGEDAGKYWVHPKDFHPNYRAHKRAADYLIERLAWE